MNKGNLHKSASRGEAETTLKHSDNDSKSEVLQKTNKKWGGVLYNYLYTRIKPQWYQVS